MSAQSARASQIKKSPPKQTFGGDQFIPHSIEAEEAVIGSILISPYVLDEVHFLKPEDFFIQRFAWMFEAALAVRADKADIDIITMMEKLEAMGRLADVGGVVELGRLGRITPSALNVEGYGRIVERMALRRRLIDAAGLIARLAHSEEPDIDVITEKAEAAVHEVTERRAASISTIKSAGDLFEDDIAEVRYFAANPAEIRGLECGIYPLDLAMGGWEESRAYWFAGPPGMGKSALLGQMSEGFAAKGHPVLYFALEMPAKEVFRRIVCARAHVNSRLLKEGKLPKEELERYIGCAKEVGKLPLHFEDRAGLSLNSMKAIAGRYHREQGIKAVVVDTLQKVADVSAAGKQYEGTTQTSVGLANWFRNSPYLGLIAAQLNRAAAERPNKRPKMGDLRDSGSQEQDADGIFGIYREGYYDADKAKAKNRENIAEIILLKNRYGEANYPVELHWEPTWPGFARLEKKVIDLNAHMGEPPEKKPKDTLEAAKRKMRQQQKAVGDDDFPLI